MELSGLGGGLMLAAAAGLWLVYLLPTWFRRREYLATERNAVRLQQTLRVMAATAELPHAVRAETSARGVLEQERALREQQRQSEASERSRSALAARAERLAEGSPELPPVVSRRAITSARALAIRRLRRTRAAVSLILLGSLLTFAVQLVVGLFTGFAGAAGAVLGFSAITFFTAFAALARLARIARRRKAVPLQVPERVPAPRQVSPATEVAETGWTPVPLPKPLYLSRPAAQPWPMVVDPEEELRIAALESDRALRAAQEDPAVAQLPAEPARPSRFASMGVVDTGEASGPDLDAVLRRRRAAG